jgi:hypothetical protein
MAAATIRRLTVGNPQLEDHSHNGVRSGFGVEPIG